MKKKILISVIEVVLSTALLVVSAILTEEKLVNPETSIWLPFSVPARLTITQAFTSAENADTPLNQHLRRIYGVHTH